MCRCILYWDNYVLGMFGACELVGGVSIVKGSCCASPLLYLFSLVAFFTSAHVAAGAGGVGTIKSVAEQAVVVWSEYATSGSASLRVAAIAPVVSVAVDDMSYSLATCGELWETHIFTIVVLSVASAMSANEEAT